MKYFFGSVLLALVIFSGCGDKKEEQKSVQKKVEPVQEQIVVEKKSEPIQEVTENKLEPIQEKTTIKKTAEKLKVTTNKVIDEGAKLAEKITIESNIIAKEVLSQTKEMTLIAMQTAKNMKKELASSIDGIEIAKNSNIDAKQLYMKCAGCHGSKAERKALNMSLVIQGWDKEKIMDAIKGYKSGTYGGAMKTVMTGQVKMLNDEEIEVLSNYISTLK